MSFYSRIQRQGARAAACVRQAFRAVLTGLATQPDVQLAQLGGLAGETLQAAELFQHFGFTSAPPAGTECIVLPLGGRTSHSIVIATEKGDLRIHVEDGETCIYSEEGAKVHIRKGRVVEVECDVYRVNAATCVEYITPAFGVIGTGEVSPQASFDGDLHTKGDVTSEGDHIAGSVSLREHVHPENDQGGPTDPPLPG